ncbi:MAG TPA: NUDIX hydrolase [Patescibacteria group bacterium]|nr:NUDIX hydrolase [Patescibacteria group bacterium]
MSPLGEYPEHPVVGVGGVVLLGGQVVLIRRANEPRKGEWSIPGGKLELGETLAEGVRRELREETGLEVEVGQLIEAFERVYRDPDGSTRFHYVILDFLCRASSDRPAAGGDASELALAGEDELDRFALNEAVERILRKGFEMARQEG